MRRSPRAPAILLSLSILLVWASPAAVRAQLPSSSLQVAVESITGETMLGHLGVLASDELEGRDTPSEGLETAATYLADKHRSYGLDPAGQGDTFFQRYPFGLMGPDPDNAEVTFVGPAGRAGVRIGRDAFVDGGSDSPLDAPLTFVRLASTPTPIPGSMEGEVAVFSLPGDWGQSMWLTSLEQAGFARASGAIAIVHVLDSEFEASAIAQLGSSLSQPTWRLGGDASLPRIFVRGRAMEEAMPRGAVPWAASSSPPTSTTQQPISGSTLQATLSFNVVRDATPPNVLAEIPGRDPQLKGEYIVLSAHFDHVGVGRPVGGDSIYNGADDNGSGTSALLEVARVLSSLPEAERPRRTILFAHVSGEEKGLLGSEWWVDHPTRT